MNRITRDVILYCEGRRRGKMRAPSFPQPMRSQWKLSTAAGSHGSYHAHITGGIFRLVAGRLDYVLGRQFCPIRRDNIRILCLHMNLGMQNPELEKGIVVILTPNKTIVLPICSVLSRLYR